MNFRKIPDNYAPVDGGLLYEIDLGGVRDTVEVAIVDTTDQTTAATLRFHRTDTVRIDIADYVLRMFRPRPSGGPAGVRTDDGRTVTAALEVDGTRSPERTFTLLAFDGLARLLTTMPAERTLAFGEFDEIAFYAPDGGTITVTADNRTIARHELPSSDAIGVLHISGSDFQPSDTALEVLFEAGGRTDELHYERVCRTPESVRLAWVASSGAVEHYTFPTCSSRRLTVDKERFYGKRGYRTTALRAEAALLLVSDFEPQPMLDALDEILTARRVWRVDGEQFTEVDVVSSSTTRLYDGIPGSVAVEIRTRKREEGLQ